MGTLNNLALDCWRNSATHGFWDHKTIKWELDVEDSPFETGEVDNPSIWAEKIALMHSEASEMLEAMRDGNEQLLAEECADLLIRLLDFTGARGIDMDAAVTSKMEKNRNRPRMHGRKF